MRVGADTEADAAYMGEPDPFLYLLCLPELSRRSAGGRAARPAAGGHPGECPRGGRVGVARSYSTPVRPWHTIWRTLANPGE
ncbi:hypothetical protein GCM10018772_55210 [Streptomyces fumanus]|uniref:Uncharacterized protein n=1 Tax=Streptomyces fumanus TaxID=67302 RepID=A0A919ASC3_9ACTN|nr:hypothetical protein GCM10018772_55210 [Streptomyces fumanus]